MLKKQKKEEEQNLYPLHLSKMRSPFQGVIDLFKINSNLKMDHLCHI
jgi:hypothetical protein